MNDADETYSPMTVAEFDALLLASVERRAAENARMREETHLLQALLERKQHLVVRLETTFAELQAEQDAINAEVRRLLTPEERCSFAGHAAS